MNTKRPFSSGLVRVSPGELVNLMRDAAGHSAVFHLDGAAISDCDSFFVAVRATLPLDPRVLTSNWNALSDSCGRGSTSWPRAGS